MQDPILFTLAVLAVLGTPGPTNTLLATAGATGGLRRSLPLVPAEAAGYLASILTLALVLGPAMSRSPVLAGMLRGAVGAYLLLLALRLWRRDVMAPAQDTVITPRQVFMTTLLNPKALVFALGIIPFGVERVWLYLLGFVLLVVSAALGWITAGAILGGAARGRGWGGMVPRVRAAAVGTFAVLLLMAPLLR